ncbi:RrF2 family transcriptional regulator [Neptunomonas antarctica]|uniref:Transcriptional regulator, BadM/Rrf2 family n=1 Tax=Neptunomonas antarctica TaxID=619304 RepID=A0A1N7P195_9GAMM|nr:Rrf2 family transcriptional regulator [Neptunomonas antarctica]SIT04209.1 transcriptional regulator, BadM/Rrf2 family [Neptunomonas antarctica]
MQLSRFTDYTLRVLFFVAINNDRLTTLAEIAKFYNISIEHLRKVVHALSKSGYLKTFRGKNGGIQLGKDPADINIGLIVAQTEGVRPIIDCEHHACRLTNFCTLQPILNKAKNAFMSVLKEYTLADLIADKPMRQGLIGSDVTKPDRVTELTPDH